MIEIKLTINPIKEEISNQKRQVDRSRRVIKRELRKLEHEKKLMLLDIKKMVTEGLIENAKLLAKNIKTIVDKYNKLDNFANYLSAISLKIPFCSTLNELHDLFFNKYKVLPIINNPSDPNLIQKIYDLYKYNNDDISDICKNPNFEFVNEEEDEEKFFDKILQEAGVKLDKENVEDSKEKIEVQFNNTLVRKVNYKNINDGN